MTQKPTFREEVNQPSIKLFVGSSLDDCLEHTSTSTNPEDDWSEHVSKPRRRRASRKFRDRQQTQKVLLDSVPTSPSTSQSIDLSTKKRTPSSIEKQPVKKSHQYLDQDQNQDLNMEPQSAEGNQKTQELVEMEARMLTTIREMINSLQVKIDNLFLTKEEWDQHKEEVSELKKSYIVLTDKMEKLEVVNQNLDERLKVVKDQIGGVNIIISGLAETAWEKESVTMDRVYDVMSEPIGNWNYQYRIDTARKMEILRVKRLGKFNKMRGRPVLATLLRKSDADFIITNRKRLPKMSM